MQKALSTALKLALGLSLLPIAANGAVLEEVVVTAQKREQGMQDVGIAVTAFTGRQLEQLGYTNAQEISALAPGVSTIQPNGPSNYALAIRGVAQNDFISNQESPVSIYVDEVYVSQMSSAGFLLFDMERVEILRGPQGTLFGRNATGGLAHYVTRKPSEEANGYAQLTGGSFSQFKFEGAAGFGLSENVLGRISLSTHNNGGYVDNRVLGDDINNADDIAGRVQLLFKLNEGLEFLLNARASKQDIRTGFFENVSSRDLNGDGLGELTPELTNFNGYRDTDGDVFAGDYDKFGFQEMDSQGISGTFKWDVNENVVMTSVTDFHSIERDYIEDSDASPLPDFNFFLVTDAEQFSQELRFEGTNATSRWTAGIYYLDIDVSDANGAETPLLGVAEAFGLPPGGLTDGSGVLPTTEGDGTFQGNDNPYTTQTESWSLFGQLEYDFSETLTGIAGFRWISEDKSHFYQNNFVDFQPGSKQRNGNPNVLFTAGEYSGNLDRNLWSAKLHLDWRPNEDLLVYGSWNRGVKG
ncbi:MAG: TonB-dependent receptor, partial [Pseudomonadota bacterium]